MSGDRFPRLIALLTDFGVGSVYVGAVHAVIAGIAPDARVIDLGHAVEPQAVDEAGFLLATQVPVFPLGTVFVCVVDPGVGSDRAIALAEAGGRRFLAPDNGLLSRVLEGEPGARAWLVRERRLFRESVSSTFHGRDIFAPVAARLATGEIEPGDVGPEVAVADLVRGSDNVPRGTLATANIGRPGRVVHVDRYGNLVTDVAPPAPGRLPRRADVAGRAVERVARTYALAPAGEPFAYLGSFGTVEVAVRDASAAAALGVRRGAAVRVHFEEASSPQ